ncbi:hypothetical protein [Zobellia sp. B3R18]|uniref:hypothetical protein n=1 Tax=Zobellia sp. B3R18 TaxID=2841568 RepID=UPI001C07D40E|nr:hypothetical protein [Zobellia sp. B3R18]MBU2974987.1 hypothetical protein [Zobellia sp. B3R18]
MERLCKHCSQLFNPRRKNHVYCCTSCKTLASYKRNQYKYVAGHYQKNETSLTKNKSDLLNESDKKTHALDIVSKKKNAIDLNSVANSALGNIAANSLSYGLKKALAPHTIPATKEDIQALQKDINQLKLWLKMKLV